MFTGPKLKQDIGASGKDVQRPLKSGHTIFIQSMGSGARFLRRGTSLLYQVCELVN